MKRIRIQSWRTHSLLARPTPRSTPASRVSCCRIRHNTTQASQFSSSPIPAYVSSSELPPIPSIPSQKLEDIPSPTVASQLSSAKLAALHARLSLPQRFPIQTLARTLVDRTADGDSRFNNASLSVLGSDVMGYYMSEHLICNCPRIPMDVLFAAQEAYVGPKALMTIAKEWGVEEAAAPGGEVDPGLLQYRYDYAPSTAQKLGMTIEEVRERLVQGQTLEQIEAHARPAQETMLSVRPGQERSWKKSTSSKIVLDDQFGIEHVLEPGEGSRQPVCSEQEAYTHFVRALMGALQLHTGRAATKKFFQNHFLSRTLDLSKLFDFRYPTRDLSRLCLREGFEPPVARLISETGRHSAHPVFVVGVYSGRDKLGEAVGSSLEEGKNRAATAALKGWYLYSPGPEATVPSEAEDGVRAWRANMVDPGEIIT